METKKNPRKDVYRLAGLWFNAGLFIAMVFVVMAFEWRSYQVGPQVDLNDDATGILYEVPVTIIDPPKPPPKPILPNPVEVEPDEPIEDVQMPSFDMPDLGDIKVIDMPDIPDEVVDNTPIIADWVEQMPEPEGGMSKFYEYVSKNIRYPSLARKMGVEGRVTVQFVVDERGNITDAKIAEGIGAGCDEEVLRILKKAPKWKPGKQRGREVKVRMLIPINFTLQ